MVDFDFEDIDGVWERVKDLSGCGGCFVGKVSPKMDLNFLFLFFIFHF